MAKANLEDTFEGETATLGELKVEAGGGLLNEVIGDAVPGAPYMRNDPSGATAGTATPAISPVQRIPLGGTACCRPWFAIGSGGAVWLVWFVDVFSVRFREGFVPLLDLVLRSETVVTIGRRTEAAGFLSPSLSLLLLSFFFGAIVVTLNREFMRRCSSNAIVASKRSRQNKRFWSCIIVAHA